MRIKNYRIGLVIVLISFMVSGCSSDDGLPLENAAIIKQIQDFVKSGTWRITSYVDSGQNETNDYVGYNFTFNEDGTIIASNSTNTINGTWSVIDDSNSSSDDDIDFNISFAAPPNFEELSDDWDIVSRSTAKIDLIDISGGNGGTDTLVFEKN